MTDRHRALTTRPVRSYLIALLVAMAMSGTASIVLRSADEYAPIVCQGLTALDWEWYWYHCWLPPDPESGKVY